MKKATLALLVLICALKGFGQEIGDPFPLGGYPFPLGPLLILDPRFDEGATTISLDGAHANPPNDSWFQGIATLQLHGNRLNYSIQTTGPWRLTGERPSMRIEGTATEFELPMMWGSISDPSYDLIVYLPGQPVPSEVVYRHFLNGSITLTALQLDVLHSGQSLLTVDFGVSGSIAGQISVIPEPSISALLFGAAAMGCHLRRRNRVGEPERSASPRVYDLPDRHIG